MLIHSPIPLSQQDLLSLSEFLNHRGKPILEKVIRGQIAAHINRSMAFSLREPMDVIAKGPEDPAARKLNIQAAKFKIFLDVLGELSRPESDFEMSKFDVE